MKILTAAEMREVDRRTIELGISGPILMENAGHRVVEFLCERFAPLSKHRVVVLCGKGNNGGDGFVIARQLLTRFSPSRLDVVATDREMTEPRRMFEACGGTVAFELSVEMQTATLVVDALLGTGLSGPARGKAAEFIGAINAGFPLAKVIAVDVPSGMNSDTGASEGPIARADVTITFTAWKRCHALPPNCDRLGELRLGQIGSPASLMQDARVNLIQPAHFQHLLAPRKSDSNKGSYGHVLVVGGASGKTGAAAMAGVSALRTGAGLVTVVSSAASLPEPELMTAPLEASWDRIDVHRKNVIALGPGLGEAVELARTAVSQADQAMVIDADGLNALAGFEWNAGGRLRAVTPHPGEMSRLSGKTIEQVQSDRIGVATEYAARTGSIVVLKGYRSVIALPDGTVWINPTGTPALAKGGTGDVLTGMIAGLLAQAPEPASVLAGVYLHGFAGQLGAERWGERGLLATDLLDFLPEAIRECASAPYRY